MLIVKFFLKFIKLLNADGDPRAVAGGLALGMILGFLPKFGLLGLMLIVLILFVNVNFSAALVGAALFSGVAWIGDPFFNRVGEIFLNAPPLQNIWTALYNTPFVPWTRFNNTLVLGGFFVGLIGVVPAFFIFRWSLLKYREKVLAAVGRWKITQALKAFKLVRFFWE